MTPHEREREWNLLIWQATCHFDAVRDARESARHSVRDLPRASDTALAQATGTAYLLALDALMGQAREAMDEANRDAAAWWAEIHPPDPRV